MTTIKRFTKAFALCLCLGALAAVPVTLLGQIPTDSWPTYHGDYSGRRFSTLKQINTTNVKGLSLAWVYRLNTSRTGAIVGGEGPDTPPAGSPPQIKSTPLMINGILYFSVPDHVWALDARTGDTAPDNAGQLLRLARRRDRQGALASRDRQHEARVLLDQRAHDHRPASDHRRRRRRARHSRLSGIARSGGGEPGVALEYDAAAR
jgi:hypothetical protein